MSAPCSIFESSHKKSLVKLCRMASFKWNMNQGDWHVYHKIISIVVFWTFMPMFL